MAQVRSLPRRKKGSTPKARSSKVRERKTLPPIQNAAQPKVSVIIPAMNERKTIVQVIHESIKAHPQTEVIVVANGSTDGTGQLAEAAGARVIHYPKPLGHDVGRSIGAIHAQGDILLFTDGDIIIPAASLQAFVDTIQSGADIALNGYSGSVDRHKVHSVVLAKYATNILLSKPELKGMSLTAIPHAISRKAAETIGFAYLSVPPVAQALAVMSGLSITAARHVEVGRSNPRRRKRLSNGRDPLEKLITGDHLEAINWLLRRKDCRGGFTDESSRRGVIR